MCLFSTYLHCIWFCYSATQLFIDVSIFHNSASYHLWLCWPTMHWHFQLCCGHVEKQEVKSLWRRQTAVFYSSFTFHQLFILRRICSNLIPHHLVPLVRDLAESLLEILTDSLHSISFFLLFLGYFMSFLIEFRSVTSLHKGCIYIFLLHHFNSCMTLFSFST